jgi:hypothetical protein
MENRVILNATTATHDMYLRGRRRRQATARKPVEREAALVDGVRGPNRNGTLDERCAWMKLRQKARRRA